MLIKGSKAVIIGRGTIQDRIKLHNNKKIVPLGDSMGLLWTLEQGSKCDPAQTFLWKEIPDRKYGKVIMHHSDFMQRQNNPFLLQGFKDLDHVALRPNQR